MILLQRTAAVTYSVQTYKVSGKTTCGFHLKVDVCVCFNGGDMENPPKAKIIEDLAKTNFEKSWGVKVQTIEADRGIRIEMEFADCDSKPMVENTVKHYISEESQLFTGTVAA